MEELCGDSTLKNLVIMIHQWGEVTHKPRAEARLQSDLSSRYGFVKAVVRRGAKIYRCTSGSEPDLGALRLILGGRSVVPEAQQPNNNGSESEQTAARPAEPSREEPEVGERHNGDIREREGSTQEAVDKEVEELRRELEQQKRKAQQEADALKKRIAEMQSKEESIRQEVSQELEEQKRKAQEEADGLRKCIAELQSELEEDRDASGEASATYNF